MTENSEIKENVLQANVAKIIDDYKVVINRGSNHGVNEGDRYLVYEISEEIIDPISGEPLGRLELAKGTGKVIHVQEKISIIESDRKRSPPITSNVISMLSGGEPLPFDNPEVGNQVKLISKRPIGP